MRWGCGSMLWMRSLLLWVCRRVVAGPWGVGWCKRKSAQLVDDIEHARDGTPGRVREGASVADGAEGVHEAGEGVRSSGSLPSMRLV